MSIKLPPIALSLKDKEIDVLWGLLQKKRDLLGTLEENVGDHMRHILTFMNGSIDVKLQDHTIWAQAESLGIMNRYREADTTYRQINPEYVRVHQSFKDMPAGSIDESKFREVEDFINAVKGPVAALVRMANTLNSEVGRLKSTSATASATTSASASASKGSASAFGGSGSKRAQTRSKKAK